MRVIRRVHRAAYVFFAVAVASLITLPAGSSADPSCTVNWTGGAGDGLWQSATNWSTDSVPSSSDVVCVGSGVTVEVTGGANQAGVLRDEGSLSVSGGSLELTSTSVASEVESLTLVDGTLTGAGTLNVSSGFYWGYYGVMSGSGKTVLGPHVSGIAYFGGVGSSLVERTFVNEGSLEWYPGALHGSDGAVVENKGTFDVLSDGTVFQAESGVAPTVRNMGTFEKTSGTGESTVGFEFSNEGSVEAKTGQLTFAGGGVPEVVASGSWAASGESSSVDLAGGTFSLGSDVDLTGLVDITGATVAAKDLQGSTASVLLTSGELELAGPTASHISGLELVNGRLTGAGTLDVSGGLYWGYDGAMAGSGKTVLDPGASSVAYFGDAGSSLVERTFVNEGSLEWYPGALHGSDGAVVENKGTFDVVSDGTVFQAEGGVASTVRNMGTFEKTSGTGESTVGFEFSNEGSVEAKTGQLTFTGGGVPELTVGGTWDTQAGATIALTGGTFLIGEEVDLSQVTVSGATVERGPVTGAPRGALDTLSYADGTVSVSGTGESTGTGFESARIEITPIDEDAWTTLCGPLTPGMTGAFSCTWNTTAVDDGTYLLRGKLSSGPTLPKSARTHTITVVVDNTAPTGSLAELPKFVSGTVPVEGFAYDATSGVGAWTLQDRVTGSESWHEVCNATILTEVGWSIGCEVDTTSLTNHEYEFRAVIVDKAGNSYSTSSVSTTIDNTALSLLAPPAISGEAVDGATLRASTGEWSGGGSISYAYQWQSCDSLGEHCANLTEAEGPAYALDDGDVGTTLRVAVTAKSGLGEETATSAATAVVSTTTLANVTTPTIVGVASAGRTLGATPGHWRGSSPISYSYQWQSCNALTSECADVPGATEVGYALGESDIGNTLRVVVTATNSEGSVSETSSASVPVAAAASTGIRYLYDPAGRLSLVDDPAQGAAVYTWDADGNMTSIGRVSDSTLSVLSVASNQAPIGAKIDITGTGFDPEPSQDAVSFNGTEATVTSATTTDLGVTVPTGATTGPITVTVAGENASSPSAFTVGSAGDALAPSISGISPTVAVAGETLTISGDHVDGDTVGTSVRVNDLYATVSGGSSSSASLTIPSFATSGPVNVGTSHGVAEGPDLFVVPSGYSKEAVGPTASLEFGVASSASFSEGQIGLFVFSGQRGHSVALQISDWAISGGSGSAWVYVRAPDGPIVAEQGFHGDGTLAVAGLPTTGDYTVLVTLSSGTTGSLSLTPQDAPEVTTTILPSSSGGHASLSLTVPGQEGQATFTGHAGQRVLIDADDPEDFGGSMQLSGPEGFIIGSTELRSFGMIDATTLPASGTYKVFIQPAWWGPTGLISLTVYQLPTDLSGTLTPTDEGASTSLHTEVPGQNAALTFTGKTGERVALQGSSWDMTQVDSAYGAASISTYIVAPNGAILTEAGRRDFTGNGFYSVQRLPEDGSYKIVVDPDEMTTGSLTLTARTLTNATGELEPSPSGTSEALSLETPGQGADLTFTGKEGEHVSFMLSSWDMSGGELSISITAPGGGIVEERETRMGSDGFVSPAVLPGTGIYTIHVASPEGATGKVTISDYTITDVTDTLEAGGPPVVVKITTPGQRAFLQFSGTEGENAEVAFSEVSIEKFAADIGESGGDAIEGEAFGTSGGSFSATLPKTDTYMLAVEPLSGETGSATVELDPHHDSPGALRAYRQQSAPRPTGTNPITATQGSEAWIAKPEVRVRIKPIKSRKHRSGRGIHRHSKRRRIHKKAVQRRLKARHASALHPVLNTPTASSGVVRTMPGANSLTPMASNYRSPYKAVWLPTAANERNGNWVTGRASSPWSSLPALSGLPATTALSGQALVIDGTPLANVTLTVQGTSVTTKTGNTGQFLLDGLPAGHQILTVDGTTADARGRRYGRFSVGVDLEAKKTNSLGYTIWMTPLDPLGDKTVVSPTRHEVRLSTPRIPGLEVRVPAGTVIRNASGGIVHQVNMTAVPVDRPPFPLPFGNIPTYFTIQPGGAYLNKGAQIIYPNWGNLPPGQRVDFWNYDPTGKGWYIYGKGSVSANGKQVIPDPDVRVWEFTGAMISSTGEPPPHAPVPGAGINDGDPVDLMTGLFVYQHTDLDLPDSSMPVALTRTYRPGDDNSYSFGIGTTSPFDIHLWSTENYKVAYLVLPEGGKIKLQRISPGTSYAEAIYHTVETRSQWESATLRWQAGPWGSGWALRRRDGTTFYFGSYAGLQAIRDRNGNQITLVRSDGELGPIVQIRAPYGRWIDLSYDSSARITEATDNAGQVVKYEYDSSGRLVKVTDPEGGTTHYAYNTANDMTSVTDARGNVLISNTYDDLNRVASQTLGEHRTYRFSYGDKYEAIAEGVTEIVDLSTTVIDPAGRERYVEFGMWGSMYPGLPVFERAHGKAVSYSPTAIDGHNAVIKEEHGTTKYTYDGQGNITSVTTEAGGEAPLKTSATYNDFGEPMSIADPLGRTTIYGYDGNGNLTEVKDPEGRRTTFGYAGEGQMASMTDPEGATTTYGYAQGDQVSVTDPQGHQTQIAYDAAGRTAGVRDPEGDLTTFSYDEDNDLTSVTDPAGQTTSYGYDSDGDLTSLTDPRGHTQKAVYDELDQLTSWTDALDRATSYTYNELGQLASVTDPKGQTTIYSYDSAERLSSVAFGVTEGKSPTSTITYGYDSQNNLVSAVDSRAGTYTMSYDAYNRLTSASGPGGSVGYTYDADGERQSMTIDGAEAASYSYSSDGQLTGISTPNGNVALTYDQNGDPTQTELPDGDTESYAYNNASQLTGITYKDPGGEPIGNLEYERDADGRVSTVSGTLARTSLPIALGAASYDAANELSSREGQTFTYDADGNLTSDGTSSYTYNDRNELSELTQGSNTWSYAYDPFGRRASKAVNGVETNYLSDGENVASETTEGKTAQLLNGLAPDERYARTTGAGTDSYFTDELGSTVALANSSGEQTTEYTYGPFGASTSTGATSTNPYQYTGRENDQNGLQYNRARYYNPETSRFTSQDPLGIAGSGTDLYAYTGGDPLNFIDPTGYSFLEELGEGITGVGDAVSGGITREIRGSLGLGQPDFSSAAYQGGIDAGILAATLTPGDEEAAALDTGEEGLDGSFSTFTRDADGNVTKYTTYGPSSPEDPEPYRPTLRYDETGRSHFNKATGEYVDTPHVHDPGTLGGVRSPLPIEIP
jgi:RHS repeat-associated protein